MINKTISKNLQNKLSTTFYSKGIWGTTDYAHELPAGMERGSDIHLAYLTLVYTVSGGQDPESVWHAAKQTFEHDPELFDPKYLAYIKPKEILDRLNVYGMLYKATPEATVWQRIGQGMVMRAKGSVQALLAASDFDGKSVV